MAFGLHDFSPPRHQRKMIERSVVLRWDYVQPTSNLKAIPQRELERSRVANRFLRNFPKLG